jgi:hypothetical protein
MSILKYWEVEGNILFSLVPCVGGITEKHPFREKPHFVFGVDNPELHDYRVTRNVCRMFNIGPPYRVLGGYIPTGRAD